MWVAKEWSQPKASSCGQRRLIRQHGREADQSHRWELMCLSGKFEPPHDKTNKIYDLCTQHRLRSAWASAQSDQSLLCAQWVAEDPMFLHADSEDSDQTGRMPRMT